MKFDSTSFNKPHLSHTLNTDQIELFPFLKMVTADRTLNLALLTVVYPYDTK